MQVTLNDYDLNSKQLRLLADIIAIEADKKEEYENSAPCCSGEPLEPTMEKPFQPELPFDGEIDTSKPKRTRRTKAELDMATKEPETVSEEAKEVEELPTQPEQPIEAPTPSKITLEQLKEKAQILVREKGREEVKKVITKYAEKLTEIDPKNYDAFMKDLEAM